MDSFKGGEVGRMEQGGTWVLFWCAATAFVGVRRACRGMEEEVHEKVSRWWKKRGG